MLWCTENGGLPTHKGYTVNPKRVRRLLRIMGLEAVYQKPNTSQSNPEHKVYPYLLRQLVIDHCDQVWSTDITYIRLTSDFVYLMAVIDWYSRYVLGWALSTSLEADFCIEAVGNIVQRRQCDIFNTDQGGSVYYATLYTAFTRQRYQSEHGWTWAGIRQYLC